MDFSQKGRGVDNKSHSHPAPDRHDGQTNPRGKMTWKKVPLLSLLDLLITYQVQVSRLARHACDFRLPGGLAFFRFSEVRRDSNGEVIRIKNNNTKKNNGLSGCQAVILWSSCQADVRVSWRVGLVQFDGDDDDN